jgi:hypothetical protein
VQSCVGREVISAGVRLRARSMIRLEDREAMCVDDVEGRGVEG